MATMRWGALRNVAQQAAAGSQAGAPSLSTRLAAVPRMSKAVLSGTYPGLAPGRLLAMLAAALYIVSPIDLVPEAILPIIGFGDDAFVVGWLAMTLNQATGDFLSWEKAGENTVKSTVL